ncbi:hypothetical protein A1D29_10920 [Pasteurellaceae bacterium Orientalotternb1]|nr:hypothetical protein A1D29_10920 [Pasteurellaceae bacterium Orientalotternb1]
MKIIPLALLIVCFTAQTAALEPAPTMPLTIDKALLGQICFWIITTIPFAKLPPKLTACGTNPNTPQLTLMTN